MTCQQDRMRALEEWEAAVSAYAAEAARHISAGLASAITGVPGPRLDPQLLQELRQREEEARRRCFPPEHSPGAPSCLPFGTWTGSRPSI